MRFLWVKDQTNRVESLLSCIITILEGSVCVLINSILDLVIHQRPLLVSVASSNEVINSLLSLLIFLVRYLADLKSNESMAHRGVSVGDVKANLKLFVLVDRLGCEFVCHYLSFLRASRRILVWRD